jgi:hypothetical protein
LIEIWPWVRPCGSSAWLRAVKLFQRGTVQDFERLLLENVRFRATFGAVTRNLRGEHPERRFRRLGCRLGSERQTESGAEENDKCQCGNNGGPIDTPNR